MKSLVRDNKSILNYLYSKVYPYQKDIILSVRVKYCLGDIQLSTGDYQIGIKTTEDMYTWVESGKNIVYCLDTSKVDYYNILYYGVPHTNEYDSDVFSDDLFDDVYKGILKGFIRARLSDAVSNLDVLHLLLESYAINIRYNSVQDFIDDVNTCHALKLFMRSKIRGDITSSIISSLQHVEFMSSIDKKMIDTCKLPLLRYDTISQYVYIPYYSYIYIVNLMSYKGSGKDYRHIVSATDIVNNNIPINIKNLDKHMRLILSSKCICTIDIGGGD